MVVLLSPRHKTFFHRAQSEPMIKKANVDILSVSVPPLSSLRNLKDGLGVSKRNRVLSPRAGHSKKGLTAVNGLRKRLVQRSLSLSPRQPTHHISPSLLQFHPQQSAGSPAIEAAESQTPSASHSYDTSSRSGVNQFEGEEQIVSIALPKLLYSPSLSPDVWGSFSSASSSSGDSESAASTPPPQDDLDAYWNLKMTLNPRRYINPNIYDAETDPDLGWPTENLQTTSTLDSYDPFEFVSFT